MNPGGIRSDLECLGTPPCKVSFGQVFTMQPFGNGLVVMTLSGAQLKRLLESQLKSGSDEPTFLQPSAGFSYTWKTNAPLGSHVLDLRLNGAPVVPTQPYRVTVNSFLAEGGDSFVLLGQGTDRRAGGLDLDALLAYMQTAPVHAPAPQPRIGLTP
jgi:5'-nucleotidase